MLSKSPYNATEAAHQAVELPLQEGSQWQTPAGFALFTAEFGRDGSDLILQGEDGTVLRLADYFDGRPPAEILSHDGASLAGRVVDRLAGPLFPGQYAQAGGFDLAQAIGQVETLTGGAFVQRTDGTTEALDVGIKVFAGDVVRTEGGSTLSITFADGTIFTLGEGSRMVLDELIYDPDATDNKGVFDLVQGGFVFIAGQAASTGGIEINTPAATMGIRGTTVKVDIQLRNGESIVTVSLNTDPDGGTGVIELRDLDGNLIANISQTDTKWIIEPPGTGVPPIEVDRTDIDFAQDSPLLTQAAAAFQLAQSRVQQGETFVELPEGNAVDDDQDVDEGEGEGVDPPPTVPPLDETGDDGGTGESGTGNPELDGQDDPLPDGNADTDTEDDAFLDGGEPTTPGSGGDSNPIITVTSIQSVEDTPFAGNLGVTSNSPDVAVSLVQGAQNGQVVLLSDGTFTYTPNPDFEGTDTFIVTATEPNGSSTQSEITVLVDPVNDAPVVASQQDFGSTFEIGANSEGPSTPAQGTVRYSDVDEGATPGTWSISAAPQNATALGTISIDPTSGAWQYDLDQVAADPLAEGEQVVETYLATITDAEGASDTSTVHVTITGSNDGPVITSSAAQAALGEDVFGFSIEDPESDEDPGEVPSEPLATGSVSGSFTFFDVDQGETPGQWSIAPSDANQTTFGSATIDPVTGEWLYTLDQMAADVLGNGDQATEVFLATVTDEFGATASQSITITVIGFNDAPTIEFSIEDITGTVFEEGYVAPDPESESAFQFARFAAMTLEEADATGTLTYTDPDAQPGALASWAIAPLDASLGTMVIDEITGQWHYFLDQSAAQSMAEGEERTETFTATVTDEDGGSSSQVITITVIGSNDEAEIIASPQDLAGAVAEGGDLIAQGQLTFVDADAAPGEVSTWSISPDGVSRGTMIIDPATGAWTYSLDETLANSIGEGDQVTETYTAALTDPLGAVALETIEITITGENDGPVITSAQLDGTVRETGTTNPGISSISGTLTAEDPDEDGTNLNWQIAPEAGNETALGDMSIDGLSGEWTYLLNNFAADSLALGQSVTESFTATVTDAFGASQSTTVVITIEGSADAPVLSADSRTLSEETAEIRVDLAALASDVDNGQDGSTLTYSLLNSPTQGQARIEGTELVFETAGDFDSLIEGQTASVVLNLQATDADGLSATSSISLTVIGTNGPPVFSDASVTLVEETTATLSLDLATLADDPDAGEDGTTLTYSILNAPIEGSVTLLGTILTFDPGTDFEDLPSDENRAVTVDLRATDVDGETATATVTVTVTGANDGPEISATSQTTGNVTEPGTPIVSNPVTASGQLFYSDPDEGTTGGTWTITPAATALGAMTIDPASGQWTYSLDQAAADSLNAGDVRTETFTATVTDVFGADASEEVQITITGTNDAPLLQADSRLIEGEQGSVTFDLEALASDIDSADPDGTLTFSILAAPAEGTATLGPAGRTLTYTTGSDFDDLAEGQTATATITVLVSDSNGASTTADMTVTVTGTNDAPVITSNAAAAAGTVVEPGFEEPGTLSATGQLTYSDVDEGETSGTWSVTPAVPGSLGTIAIDPASGEWTYTLDADSADSLDAGDTVTETFEAIYTDALGAATAPQVLTITIEGTNDAPLMTAATLTVDEDTAGTIDLKTLTTDPDASDDPSSDITFSLTGPTEKGTASIVGGILSFDPDGDFDDLATGVSEEAVLGITLSDPEGGTSTSTVTITVTGTNDGPVITSGPTDAAGTAIESGEGPATPAGEGPGTPAIVAADTTGQLSYVDPDETPTTPGSWSVDAIGPSYGTMNIDSETGAWSYFLSPTLSDSLRQGETVEDRWTAVITDAEGAQAMEVITITITGTNDAPVIDDVTSLTERGHTKGGPTILTGQLVANDPDTFVDAPTWTITRIDGTDVEARTYGTMAINNNGLWSYTVHPEDVETLGEGETAMETFRATVRDEFGQTDEVTVKVRFVGTNSAPELVIDISETDLNVSEAGDGRAGSPVAVGQLSYFDNDEGETNGTWSITPTGDTTYGSVSINPLTGQWRYELDQEKADSLTEGEQVTETFSATYTDAFGASTAPLPLSITISGSNDAPTLTASDLAVSQGGSSSVDLSPLAADVDHALADLTFSISSPPAKGAATITDGGELTFTTEDAFAGLGDGATEEVDISVVVADPDGATVTQTVTVTVTGTNDAPEIDSDAETFDVSDTLAETDNALTTSGEFDVTDIDEGDIVTVTGITLAAAGVLNGAAANDDPTLLGYFSTSPGTVIDAETDSGPLSWTWNSGSEAFDYLATDETLVLTYNIALADDATPPGQVTQEVVITIEGTNDAPVITGSATAALTETADTTGDSATLTATDRLDFSDADLSDVDHAATVSGVTITGASGGLPGNAALLGLLSLTAAKSPSGTDGTIDWTFTAEDQTFDYLAKDETVTLSYEVTLSDGNGGTDTTTVAVTITGSNDLPVAVADTFTVNEDDSVLLGNILNNDTDPDGDTLQLGSLNNPSPDFEAWNLGTTTNGEVTIFPGTQFQSLAQGETEIATVQYRAEDGSGGNRTSTITINITGVNDAPTLTAGTLNANENTTDAPLDLAPFGDDIDNDDDGDSLTYSIISGPEEGTVSIEEGVLSFDANGDFEDLGEGETRTVTVELLATDSNSATSEIVPFSIVVTGVNSAAAITGALSGVITEDEVPNTVGGDLDSVDPDTSDADDLWEVPEGTISTTYGSATYDGAGNWVYTLDNSDPAITGMSAGDSLTDSFSAFTIDGTEQVVNITIDGADDAALIDGDTTDSVAEDDAIPLASGNLDHTDDDDDDPDDLWAAAGPGATTDNGYGTFEITTTGQWTYTLNGTNTEVRALNAEDTLTDTFTVNTSDGTDQLITVTIDGANDEATISGDLSGTAFEDGASAEGDINHEDPDDADDAWTPQASIAATYGTLSINAAGEWEYTVDNANSAVNALNVGDTLSDSVIVTTTGGTEATINVTIAGANDAAIVLDTSDETGSVNEDSSTITVTGDMNHTDVDNANDLWVAQGPTDIDYGRYSVNTNGFWIFTLFNANAETNALGDSDTATTNFVATTLDGTTQTVTITINGADDPVEITGDFTGVATEDAEEESVYGNLDYTDVDAGAAQDEWVGVEVGFSDGGYGTYQIDESGNWTYSLDNGNTDVNALGEDDSLTDTFTVSATDGTEQQITITIEGSNDGPVAMSETATFTLDKGMFDPTGWTKHGDNYYQFIPPNAITSEFTWEDARAAAAAMGGHLATVTSASENAFLQTLHFNPTGWLAGSDAGTEGTWIWVEGPEAGQQFWQGGVGGSVVGGLYANWNAGQPDNVLNEDYLHTFSTGAWNDINESSALGFFVEYSGPQATGSVAGNDVSIDGGSLTYTLEGEDVIDGLTLFADGSWTYDLDSSAFEYLNDGETTSTSTTYTITDENGETDTATLTLEITGINDAAVIVGDTTGSVTEDDPTDTVSGTLTHTDVDSGDNDSVFQDVSVQTASANGYGTYTIGTGTTGGIWTYRLDNTNTAVNELLDGENLTDSFTVLAEDGTEQEITITIEGENDAPLVTAGAVLAYTENDAAIPIDDGIALSDADGTQLEGATVAITGGFQSGEDSLSFVDQNGITGSYSTATGVLTLAGTATLAQYEAALQSVAYANSSDAPSEVDRTIGFTVNDGIVASATVTSTVAVVAVNDAPVIDTVTSDLAGVLTSFIEDRLPTTSAVSEAPSFVRAPTIYGGGYPYEKFAGVAFDPVTGKVYESVGVDRYTESAVRVFADTASFEAGTVLTTINLGTASNGSSTDIHGTYFSAYDDVLIGKSGGASDFEGKKEIAFWNATNGAVLNEITPIPGVLTIGQTNYGFNWGGHTGISVIQDSSGIYALGKTSSSTWALAEIDPVSQSVVGTEFFNAGNQGFAFAVEGLIFFGDYNTGYVSKVYNIGANTLSNVNISLNARGGTNDYWSNTSYDIATDTLYMVNSPNSTNGLIYKIENISGLVLTPSMLPTGKIVFDDPDTMNVFAVHDVTVTEPDSTPYFGSLTVGAPVATSATEYEVSWEYHISQADYDSLAAGQTITENFEVTINDGGLNGIDTETVTIVTTGINDAPEVKAGGTLAYSENDSRTPIDDGIALSDVDDSQLDGATVTITGGFQPGEDSLSFADQNGISGSYSAATGILTLSGTAAVAVYETALQSVAYANSSDDPSEVDRTISYTVSDGDVDSAAATSTVTVEAVNDGPSIMGATSPGSLLVNDSDVFDRIQTFGQGITLYANDVFYAGDEVIFDMQGLPQSGISFRLFNNLNQTPDGVDYGGQTLPGGTPGIRLANGDSQVFSHVLTEDEAGLRYRGDATGVGGNPGFDVDASVISGKLDVDEDTTGTFGGVSIADPDIGGGSLSITLSVDHGDLTMGTIMGLTLSDSDGTDGTLAFTGALSDVNAALADLYYSGDQDFNGQDFLDITVNDQGNAGSGGALSESKSVVVDVVAVNDTPVAVQDTATTAEDTSVSIDVLDNDSDVDSGDMLVIASLSQPANGTAAVNGAGEVTYTPDRDFNGIDTFTYVASDGSGSTVTESVTVTVTPVDDPVIARADFASTDQDTAVVIDVIANDEDPEDAAISVSSVGTAANGLVSLSSGVVTYTPDTEFFGIDTFTYQVTDSTAGNVTQTVTVVVNQDPEEFPIENPPTLSFNLTGGGGSPAGSVTIEVDPVASNGVNIAFGLDESGSITGGQFVTMIDSVKLAVANLVADFAGSSTSLDVHITPFDGDVDTSGPMQPQSFTVHTAAGVTNLTAFNSYMDAVKAAYNGGSTNWDAAFLDLKTFFDAQESTAPDDVNVAYFITDGNPNTSVTTPTWQTTTSALRAPPLDVDINAFAIGSNVTEANLTAIDANFQTLASANDLTAAFDASPLFNARLAEFSLILIRDGESVGEIADETIFTTPLTGIAFELPLADIQGLSGLLGDDNLFVATAEFDTDGDTNTLDDRLQIVTQGSLSKAATSQDLTGTSESDLLLGGDLDDTLVGLDGNDVLMGFGGSDSILGGLGNDSITTSGTGAQMIDGGAGRDVLTFQTDADITSSVLTALNIQNVEVLNITNNENNILTLTADRAGGLPSIASDLLSVLGETGDTVVLEDSATRFYRTNSGGTITDINGNVLDIYAIEDGSGALISAVAVDQDMAVSFLSDPAHTEGDGDLPFFYTEFDESEGVPVLEVGTEAGLGSGTATVDLSGIEALAPDILKDVAVIDMRNGQANEFSIDAADLLNIIEGNDASENEYIWIQIDPEDTVTLVDDGGVPGSEGWDAESQAGNPNVYDISDTGGFGAYADTFATIFIDDGSAIS